MFQDSVSSKDIEDISLSSVLDAENAVGGATAEEALAGQKELDSEEEFDLLSDMIQTSQFHHPHHRAFQVS